MNKKKQMNFNLNSFTISISSLFDKFFENYYGLNKNHLKKIAFISLNVGQKLNFDLEKMSDLCSYSLSYNNYIFNETSKEEILKLPFNNVNNIDSLKQIVSFSDKILQNYSLDDLTLKNKEEVLKFIQKNEDKLDEEIIDIYFELFKKIDFYLDMNDEQTMVLYFYSVLADFTKILDFEEVLDIAKIYNNIVTCNNKIVDLSLKACDYFGFDHKDKLQFTIAITFKNIGKIFIPKDILDKNDLLSKEEYETIKQYPYYTRKVLLNNMGFNDIALLSSIIQENIDGNGYPFGIKGSSLSFKDRLIKVLSIYESLSSNKSFRKAYTHCETIKIMKSYEDGFIDKSLIEEVDKLFLDFK